MNSKKLKIYFIIATFLFSCLSLSGVANAAVSRCPLQTMSAYKVPGTSAVYYITSKCTKQVFSNPSSYFQYFKSWSSVRRTSKKYLNKILPDAMYVLSSNPVSPQQSTTCSGRSWSCGDWSECQSTGQEVRTCSLISGCSGSAQEQPVEYRSCTPVSPQSSLSQPVQNTSSSNTSWQQPLSGVVAEYLTCPTDLDMQTINKDFDITFMDANATAIDGNTYPLTNWSNTPYSCSLISQVPSRTKLYATLRFLKDIKFSQPLPFTRGLSLYDFLTLKSVSTTILAVSTGKLSIEPLMECNISSHGFQDVRINAQGVPNYATFNVVLNGSLSYWQPIESQSNPCAVVQTDPTDRSILTGNIANPIYSSSLLVHEAYHAITNKTHDVPNGNDASIDEMGAWAAQFYYDAWVGLYSTNVDPGTKALAKDAAASLLNRFTDHCPSDTYLKSVVNQVSPNSCP